MLHEFNGAISQVCARYSHVNFVIGGDGPKYPLLVDMVKTHKLKGRVELLGNVPHADVARVLNRGQLFLNVSLTEGGAPSHPTYIV